MKRENLSPSIPILEDKGEKEMPNFDGVLAPGGTKSIRQDQLPEDARHIIAYLFALGVPVNDIVPIPVTAVEVRIENAIDNILNGGASNFNRHGGSDSLEYFKHHDDENWAVVFISDCDGDAMEGKQIIDTMIEENYLS